MVDQPSFSDFIGNFGERSWVVLFAEADAGSVRDAYASVTGSPTTDPLPITAEKEHRCPPTGAVVSMADSSWTVIFHLVGTWDEFDSANFSKKLNARVVAYEAEDTSGATQCTVLEPSGQSKRLQVSADAESEDELMEEMAEYANEMGIENASPDAADQIDDYEDYLRSLGISFAKLFFTDDYGTAIVDAADVDRIESVVLVRQPE